MKTTCLILATLLPGFCFAQITLTQSDLPQAGDTWGLYTDADGGTQFAITPGGSSAQTWNYLSAFDNLSTFAFQWSTASSVIGGAQFPGSDLGIDYGGYSSFYSADATGLYNEGSYIPLTGFTSTEHITGGLILPVPFTYGGTRTFVQVSTSITILDDGEPAIKVVRRSGGDFSCDAFGTISTPTYPSGTQVLRIVQTRDISVDSTYIDMSGTGNGPWTFSSVEQQPGSVAHLFVRNGQPALVADIGSGGLSATYYSGTAPDAVAENGSVVRKVLAYPVPSSDDMVHFPLDGHTTATLEVLNTLGQTVKRIPVSGADIVHLSTTMFAEGTYTFKCLGTDGAVVGQGRFVVAR